MVCERYTKKVMHLASHAPKPLTENARAESANIRFCFCGLDKRVLNRIG
jgi:hypothetical protein